MFGASSMESAEIVSDFEFMWDDDRLPKVPKVLRMSRKEMFALAAKEFKLTIQLEKTTQVDGDMYITKLAIGNMWAKDSYDRETKEFSGNSAVTKNLSIENAYHAALKDLENQKRIKIDDYNAEHVLELKNEVFRSSTWLMLFEDKAKQLKNEISGKNMVLREFLSSFDSLCQEVSAVLPRLPPRQKASPGKRKRKEMIPSASKTDAVSILFGLSDSLMKLREEFLPLVPASTEDVPLLPKEAGTSANK